ncbi:MAG: hypothetical protein SFY56_12150 [Bacteroidota bacterium]|nr:hypothetical protein [Bacteroidota bacterium]
METLPLYVYVVFALTVLVAILLFYKATHYSKKFLTLIFIWLIFQSIISILGFYNISNTIPPRFGLLIIPPLIITIIGFNTKRGKQFIDGLNIRTLAIFHVVRIPVELVLYWLFVHKTVPELMTFEGRNFDIISGLTAPIIFYFGFIRKKLNKVILLLWNFIGLALLFNIVFNAILSVPSEFQQFAFEQPNIAILQFPFVLLPSILVPFVLFSHLTSIRQLLNNKSI